MTLPPPSHAPSGNAVHLLTKDGRSIRGVLEYIPACSEMAQLHIEPDGSLGFETLAFLDQWEEDAHPVARRHPDTQREGFILIDLEGHEHHEDDVLRCLPGARIPGCPCCQAAVGAVPAPVPA